MKEKRNYNKEYEREKKKVSRINFKINNKYNYLIEQIKEEQGLSKFLVNSIKNYNNKELILTVDETAHLMAIIENYLQKYNTTLDDKYLKEVGQLEEKIRIYYDDIFKT